MHSACNRLIRLNRHGRKPVSQVVVVCRIQHVDRGMRHAQGLLVQVDAAEDGRVLVQHDAGRPLAVCFAVHAARAEL